MGVGGIFPARCNGEFCRGSYKDFSRVGPKVVKFNFSFSKISNLYLLKIYLKCKISKSRGRGLPSDAHSPIYPERLGKSSTQQVCGERPYAVRSMNTELVLWGHFHRVLSDRQTTDDQLTWLHLWLGCVMYWCGGNRNRLVINTRHFKRCYSWWSGAVNPTILSRAKVGFQMNNIVAVGNPEQHVRKASHRGSKQQ